MADKINFTQQSLTEVFLYPENNTDRLECLENCPRIKKAEWDFSYALNMGYLDNSQHIFHRALEERRLIDEIECAKANAKKCLGAISVEGEITCGYNRFKPDQIIEIRNLQQKVDG